MPNLNAAVARVRGVLDQAERGGAVGPDAAQLAVKIGLSRREQRYRCGDRRVFMRPVKPGAGQQPDGTPVQPGMHPVAVEFDFMEPVWPVGRTDRFDAPRAILALCSPWRG